MKVVNYNIIRIKITSMVMKSLLLWVLGLLYGVSPKKEYMRICNYSVIE